VGSAIFLALFASANPVIGDALANIRLPTFELSTFVRLLWWIILLTLVWATLRPRCQTARKRDPFWGEIGVEQGPPFRAGMKAARQSG
jgi:hypothetical protein